MKYKLICIDMDGTLLGEDHSISSQNIEAIKRAYDKGVIVAMCTGRLFYSALQYSNVLGINGPIISSNGTYVRERNKKDVIYKSTLSSEEVIKVCQILERNGIDDYYINTYNSEISQKEFPENNAYLISNKESKFEKKVNLIVDNDILDHLSDYNNNILKVIAINEKEKEKLARAKEELRSLDEFEVVSSRYDNIEIMKKNSSKGEGVKALADSLSIKREEVICIGDNENDISMIKYAGLGIAVGNAIDELKKEADYITDTNVNSGVAKAINKFIL